MSQKVSLKVNAIKLRKWRLKKEKYEQFKWLDHFKMEWKKKISFSIPAKFSASE